MKNLDRELLHEDTATLVLAMLAENECHGYRLRQQMALRSHHYFQCAFGRLYPLFRELEQRDLVKARWVKAGKVRQRKQYKITVRGRADLAARVRQWRHFVAAMERVLPPAGR